MKEYILAKTADLDTVFNIVQNSIKSTYPKYYPKEVVDFFCNLHSRENILKDIECGSVGIFIVEGKCVGTGCYKGNHITRVYVEPEYQGKGYGTYIMDRLEEKIAKKASTAVLDASLPAAHLYSSRGYKSVEHCKYPVENNVILVYEVMEKELTLTRKGKSFIEMKIFQVKPDKLEQFESKIEEMAENQLKCLGCISLKYFKRFYTIDGIELGEPPRELTKIVKCVKYYSFWEFDTKENYGKAIKAFFDDYNKELQKLLIAPFDINLGDSV